MQGRVAGLQNEDKPAPVGEDAVAEPREAAQRSAQQEVAITEIGDEDYRSFCYPCYALEELLDRKRGN